MTLRQALLSGPARDPIYALMMEMAGMRKEIRHLFGYLHKKGGVQGNGLDEGILDELDGMGWGELADLRITAAEKVMAA